MPRIRSSCLSPKPETLNPETEKRNLKGGPEPGPLYTPRATHECETEQTCESCGQTLLPTLRRFVCCWRRHKHVRYEQLSSHCCSHAIRTITFSSTPDNSAEPQVSWNYTSAEFFQSSSSEHECQTEEAPAARNFYISLHDQNMRTY